MRKKKLHDRIRTYDICFIHKFKDTLFIHCTLEARLENCKSEIYKIHEVFFNFFLAFNRIEQSRLQIAKIAYSATLYL